MKSKLTRLIRFFAFQGIILLFALHVSGQSINGIELPPACTNCYGTSVVPALESSTLGYYTVANDSAAFASGLGSTASGKFSTAFGYYSRALKHSSFAAGYRAKADSAYSVGLGYYSEAVNHYTFAFGKYVKASALNSMVIGKGYDSNSQFLNNDISNSIMLGMGSTNPTVTILGATTGSGYGKVGIAKSDPQTELDVYGTTRTSNLTITTGFTFSNGASNGYVLKSDASGNAAWASPTSIGLWLKNGSYYYYSSGNVGIGISSPTQKLDVNGTIKTTGFQLPNGSGSGKLLQSDGSGIASWVEPATVTNWTINGNIMNTTKIVSIHNPGGTSTVYGSFMIGNEFVFYGSDASSSKIIGNNYKWDNGSKRINEGFASTINMEDASGKIIFNTDVSGLANSTINWKTMAFTPEGKLGIGTSSPQYTLDVQGTNEVKANMHSATASKSSLWVSNNLRSFGFGVDEDGKGHIYRDINQYYNSMTFTDDGKVLIGDTATTNGNYKLYVNGSILTTEVKIAMVGNWPDYVFKNNYKPMNLSDLETYINQNHHLPDVPSETEVKENGMNLAENDAMLLKKIEELTLYILQQGKKIENLETELGKLKENK